MAVTKHGMWKSKEWNSWNHLKGRCNNPNDPKYPDYGGRGIKVCDRWADPENGFINFLEDMGFAPTKNHSIDRFPNNETGHYEKDNCRWALPVEQSNNTRRSVNILFNGETKSLSEWAKCLVISKAEISSRLKNGQSVEMALRPTRKRTVVL